MAAPVLQLKRGLLANLPGLRGGEPGFTTDSYDLYVGIDSTTNNNKFFGSHRYWTKNTTSTGSGINLVEGTSNGTDYITIKSPDSLAGIVTYTFPGVQGAVSSVLTNNGSGTLTWASGSANPVFSGIATFTDGTDNTLGNADTGAVQIDGGLGINKNLTVGANLNVQGYSEFVGVVTFKGGTINLGDDTGDNINVGGEFISNLTPNVNNTFDIGISTQKWRDAYFAGIGSFATGAYIDAIQIGISGASEIDTTSGNLTLDSASGQTIIDDNLSVTGIATVTGAFVANSGINVTGQTTLNNNLSVTGVSTFTGAIDANGGADISGGETTLSSATVSDLTSGRVVLAGTSGSLQDSANLTFSAGGLIVGSGGLNVTGVSTFSTDLVVGGDIRVNGNDIQASDGATNITLTSSTLTTFAGDIKVTGNDIQSSSATAITLSGTDVTVAGDLTVTGNDIKSSSATAITLSGTDVAVAGDLTVTGNDIKSSSATALTLSGADVTVAGDLQVTGNDIKSSTGAVAITLAANDVTIADDLTVGGNLYVNGSTTQVNTTALTVEDRTIDLGIVNGATPSGTTTWDLGILFNYYSGSAKKSAVIWEHTDARFKFASVAGADTDGTDVNTPQLTVTTFAPIEIGALWVNDCAGQSQVISCTAGVRNLENITIDAGAF